MVRRQGYFAARFLQTAFKNSLVVWPSSSSGLFRFFSRSHARCGYQSKIPVFKLPTLTALLSCSAHENDSDPAL